MTNDNTGVYDPDEDARPGDIERLQAKTLTLKPSPSPDPDVDSDSDEESETAANASAHASAHTKAPATQGDAVLLTLLGNGNGVTREVAQQATINPLPPDEDMEQSSNEGSRQKAVEVHLTDNTQQQQTSDIDIARAALNQMQPTIKTEAGADGDPSHKPLDHISPSKNGMDGILPPIQAPSPDAKTPNNVTLPSISEQLKGLDGGSVAKSENVNVGPHRNSYVSQNSPQPPPFYVPGGGYSPANTSRKTPPISPPDHARRQLPSPENCHSYYTTANLRRYSLAAAEATYISPQSDYNSGSTTETPSTDQSTPGGMPVAAIDRMSIDGITNPPVGGFVCTVENCTAAPFQTQYLLNSHANVHSQNRPHYCPVPNCPRSAGGKGFKRKNEMIRHGLVHESPGYVCPYCKDREHKYPRPDNLQRYVASIVRIFAPLIDK